MPTCKTHEEFGKVAFMPMNSSCMLAFTGLMSWVALVLHDTPSKWKHMCGSTDGFLKRITNVKMEENVTYVLVADTTKIRKKKKVC